MEEKKLEDKSSLFEKIAKIAVMPIVLAAFITMIIPIPTLLLDIFIAVNIFFALAIFIIVICVSKLLRLSFIPGMFLVSTIFSLVVNIATVRLILTKGADFDGRLIRFVSSLFIGSGEIVHLIIAFAIFFIIFSINTFVIVKGATRIAEIACRFTLDSMPINLMAIETEYSSGAISEEEAALLQETVRKESAFYGALDGATKFITGNEKINIVIIAVIVIGGILIDTLLNGKSVNEAALTYIPLAIGSGILFMVPSLLVSVTTGVIVTREIKKVKE